MTRQQDAHLPTVMPTTNRPINLGTSLDDHTSRLDGVAKVTGAAKYSRDMLAANQLFIGFLRCPFGRATLDRIDRDAALAVKGVVEVEMMGRDGRYHGHPVGYVVAESKAAAQRGLRALHAVWMMERPRTSLADGASEVPAESDETAQLFREADHVIEATYDTEIQTHSSLETHGLMVDHTGERATVYASTQGTFAVRDQVAEPLGLRQSQYEVICEYVGGGFGSKFQIGVEGMIAARVAAKHHRPVMSFCDRAEEHLDTGCRPSSRSFIKLAVQNDGTILGGQIQTWGGVGVARGGGGVTIPSGRYNFGAIQRGHEDVQFNTGAPRAMRAPGRPQGAFAEELVVDEIAAACNLDPLALRRKLDRDANRQKMYELGARMIGWHQRQPNGSQRSIMRRGFGVGATDWGNGKARADAEVAVFRDGSIVVRTGTQDIGTGQRTIMAVLVAENLGVPLRMIDVEIGSSNLPYGPASGGSTTGRATAPAMIAAAIDVRNKLLDAIAPALSTTADQLQIRDGQVVIGDDRRIPWSDACRRLSADSIIGRGTFNQNVDAHWGEGHSAGVQFVDLSVDSETGIVRVNHVVAIQSCGKAVSRKTVESQIIGGVIQGISFALFENKWHDRRTGAMVNPNLEWYKILGSSDMPHIEPVIWDEGQTGVRSLGEPPVVPTAGAVAGAIFNAIGAPVRSLPMTPDKVLSALDAANGGAA